MAIWKTESCGQPASVRRCTYKFATSAPTAIFFLPPDVSGGQEVGLFGKASSNALVSSSTESQGCRRDWHRLRPAPATHLHTILRKKIRGFDGGATLWHRRERCWPRLDHIGEPATPSASESSLRRARNLSNTANSWAGNTSR